MPLQNREQPDGEIVATSALGMMFGNRGGKFHDPQTKTLHPKTRWASKHWICCALKFKDYSHPVMGKRYTGLFFLDEVTALAAGHRPCFECRRADAVNFAEHWQKAQGLAERPKVGVMDTVLHAQRLDGRAKKKYYGLWVDLPDGAVVKIKNELIAKRNGNAFAWSFNGYTPATYPTRFPLATVLTPPAILDVLEAGYTPQWHPSTEVH